MKQFSQKVWNGFKQHPVLFSTLAIVLMFLLVIITETIRLDNTGFKSKTLWDWMDLFLVPALLALGIWWLNKTERENDRVIASKQRENEISIAIEKNQQTLINSYFNLMTDFLLEKDLRNSNFDSEIHIITRTQTLNIFRNLENNRKWQVLLFLYEANLISKKALVDLNGVNLNGIDSGRSSSLGVSIKNINLSGAILNSAILTGLDFSSAQLEGVVLNSSVLAGVNLSQANLRRSVIVETDLRASDLRGADLRESIFTGTDFRSADLRLSDLRGARLDKSIFRDEDIDEEDIFFAEKRQNLLLQRNMNKSHEVLEIDEFLNLRKQNRSDKKYDLRGARFDNNTRWPPDFNFIEEGALIFVLKHLSLNYFSLILETIERGECFIKSFTIVSKID